MKHCNGLICVATSKTYIKHEMRKRKSLEYCLWGVVFAETCLLVVVMVLLPTLFKPVHRYSILDSSLQAAFVLTMMVNAIIILCLV